MPSRRWVRGGTAVASVAAAPVKVVAEFIQIAID
jgi:hypothetical protein